MILQVFFIITKLIVYYFVIYNFPGPLGNIYIADFSNQRIRKVSLATGIITTIAGSSTSGTYSGDNGQATAASSNYPSGVSLDSSGMFALFLILYSIVISGFDFLCYSR